jgi:hypothetical protein
MKQVGLGNSLFTFWSHGDIVDLQNSIRAALLSTDATVNACAAIDSGSKTSWTSFYTQSMAYANADAAWLNTGTQADAGQSIQRQILAWQQYFKGKGCALNGPLYDTGDSGAGKGDQITSWLKYGAIIAASWGTAYVISQVVTFIPHPVSSAKEGTVLRERRRPRRAVRRRRHPRR